MNGSIPEQHTNAEGLALTPRGQSPHSMAIGSSSNVGTPSNHSFDGYESAQEGGESFLSSAMKTVLQPPLDDFVEEFPLVIEKEFPEGLQPQCVPTHACIEHLYVCMCVCAFVWRCMYNTSCGIEWNGDDTVNHALYSGYLSVCALY